MGFAHEYATAIVRRGRYPMEPADFVPDWADRPRKGKHFPGAEAFPLPQAADLPDAEEATVQRGLFGPRGTGSFTLPLLAGMLQESYGLVGRRLAVQANSDLGTLPMYTQANWSRGTASGGGLYPVGVHWVAGPSGPLTPGVYYYSTPHHDLRRLLAGDVTAEVRAAGGEALGAYDQFLVLGVRFWQNAFKYNSFSYHVVTMDTGALLETWRIWARARGLHIGPALWFDEARLGRLLGLEEDEEGVFAVVPLRWERPAVTAPPAAVPPRVRYADQERSRTTTTFETVRRMHAATLDGAARRPPAGALDGALALPVPGGGERTALPAPRELDTPVGAALRARRSSFGRFQATTPLPADALSTVLAAVDAAGTLDSDTETPGGGRLSRAYVFVNHVAGVDPGSYLYDRADGSLRLVAAGAPGGFLQRNYFLANYNLEQAAAVIVPVARTTAVLDAVGDRGYRLVNAVIGGISQAVYTASAAAGLSCGVALGFDAISFTEELALEETGEVPLLIMMIGHERPRPADFRYEIA
ncbi:nitroreductase family protein [Actinacidiphila paucisporea]|uniref:SagB-type dehydrogenase domain-containing protein n=1 Tax=Actinacidiphila paucisporea TaxID=310782 RepID=A0A1M7K7Z3_9ACTN|nr:nitroreductase family protein [Actinacidiphila paucisporea]SHM61376.1 SagB-type dehydrogenase domain-containing protein [Actinacidiphila paucisporea]